MFLTTRVEIKKYVENDKKVDTSENIMTLIFEFVDDFFCVVEGYYTAVPAALCVNELRLLNL